VTLFEAASTGRLAARLATQVIKAYIDKKRRQPNQVVQTETDSEGRVPTQTETEMASLWTEPSTRTSSEPGEDGDQRLQAGRFRIEGTPRPARAMKTAPGLETSLNGIRATGRREGRGQFELGTRLKQVSEATAPRNYNRWHASSHFDFDWTLLFLVLPHLRPRGRRNPQRTLHSKFAGAHLETGLLDPGWHGGDVC